MVYTAMRVLVAAIVIGVVALAGCGTSHEAFSCPVSVGHTINTPLTGRLVVLGQPPVELWIDNRGDLRQGVVVLGTTNYPRWFALKSHFITPPTYRDGFTVRVHRLGDRGGARLGDTPSGTSFTAPAGPTANETAGWRDFPGAWTWTRGAGCYEWNISGQGFHESIVARAIRKKLDQ